MKENDRAAIIDNVYDYYTDKFTEYGATPRGVDWNGAESQTIRFEQLLKLFPEDRGGSFSVADLGCGYGAFYQIFRDSYVNAKYQGYDISDSMVEAANRQLRDDDNATAYVADRVNEKVDYSVASGIFSVQLEANNKAWLDYIIQTLDQMNDCSIKGFAFNCLTSYSDSHLQQDYLYYADPLYIFDQCKRRYSNNVAMLHDYNLFEFTVLVRK